MIVSDDRVAKFVSEAIGFALCPPYTCMGIFRGGRIVAGVIFNQFEGADVQVTVAGKGWNAEFIEAVRAYVFDQLGCERMTVTTEQKKVERLAIRFGGVVEGRLRNHFGKGRDGIIVGILKDEFISVKVTYH